jgi:hypothetical protein
MVNILVNLAHWFDIRVLRNGNAYRRWFVNQGFFTANEWSDTEVLDYLHR